MKRLIVTAVVLVALTASLSAVFAQAKKKPFVYVPFSKLQLTEDQAAKIGTIQAEVRTKIKALEEEEFKLCSEVLTADQKAELVRMDEEDKAKARARSKAYQQKKKEEAAAEKAKQQK